MRKIWIAYTLSIFWMIWFLAGAVLRDILSRANDVLVGAVIADFIIATIPLWIVFVYHIFKKQKKNKVTDT
ncbi:MAG: hypothetical protein ACYDAJ_11740 [Nitrosotalea sp.]